ncbi:hypothetical protein F3Y22_tig00110691pilonHSYRG00004 [Hibiscus syriacus]|uniref:Disease resistance protein winged helix domain-containing protein n=1 Tax=Hibiscus syriacus TaxID=106335 RepID=A0A6A2ZX75_HIBSY|nr:hypothetical protein F3Y22_tig00110691pilonHSYRG00004 [Hibiscus syriacus]
MTSWRRQVGWSSWRRCGNPRRNFSLVSGVTLAIRIAFERKGGQCPPYLVSSARKLIAKCEGLPLAIVALSGLMATKNSIAEWNVVYNNLNKELSENDSYFVRLRINSGSDAEKYLNDLICRGLLQVVKKTGSGRPKACKMHDILLEFSVFISKMEKFVAKSDDKEVEDDGIHRWSIAAKEKEMKAGSKTALSRVRSLFVFAVDETSKSSFNRLPSGFNESVGFRRHSNR